jgi:hypothetical protein
MRSPFGRDVRVVVHRDFRADPMPARDVKNLTLAAQRNEART